MIANLGIQRNGANKIRDFESVAIQYRQSEGGLEGDVNVDRTY